MKSIELDLSRFIHALESVSNTVAQAAKTGMHDVLDEWKADAVDLAPLDKGTLRRGIDTEIDGDGLNISGKVTAVAVEVAAKGKWAGKRFNYAYYLHEVFPLKHGRSFKNPSTAGTIPEFIDTPAIYKGNDWMRQIEDEIERELKRKGW